VNQILPEFQKFMADRRLALENQIPFYAGWASKFIRFSNAGQSTPTELKIQLFLDDLKKKPEDSGRIMGRKNINPPSPNPGLISPATNAAGKERAECACRLSVQDLFFHVESFPAETAGVRLNPDPHAVAVDLPAAVVVDVFVAVVFLGFSMFAVFHIGISFHDRAFAATAGLSEAGGGGPGCCTGSRRSRVPKR